MTSTPNGWRTRPVALPYLEVRFNASGTVFANWFHYNMLCCCDTDLYILNYTHLKRRSTVPSMTRAWTAHYACGALGWPTAGACSLQ